MKPWRVTTPRKEEVDMVQVDVPMAFATGAFFADAARRRLATIGRVERHRLHAYNLVYQVFFFCWVPVYFLLNYFGWETTHMWWHADSVVDYPFYVPLFLVVFFAAAICGCALGQRLVVSGRTGALRVVYLTISALCLVWVFGLHERTFRLGTYADWQSGGAVWFHNDSTFLTMLVGTLVWWAFGLVLFRHLLQRPPGDAAVSVRRDG